MAEGMASLRPVSADSTPGEASVLAQPYSRPLLRRALASPRAVAGAALVGLMVLLALLAPLVAPADPLAQDIANRLLPPVSLASGSAKHLLGTDQLGRDLLSRIIYGARPSLAVALGAVALAATAGVSAGLASGYYQGRLDQLLMRLADIQLAFPFMLLAITVLAVFPPGLTSVMVVLAISGWPTYARLVRAQVLRLREQEFIAAARLIGASDGRLMLRHILPNTVPVIMIVGTVQMANAILAEAALSFLGFGIQPPTPSWGNIINEGQEYIFRAWWIATFPGIAIVAVVSGAGLLGDWLRDVLDPRLRV